MSPRELAVRFTDTESYFVSEAMQPHQTGGQMPRNWWPDQIGITARVASECVAWNMRLSKVRFLDQ